MAKTLVFCTSYFETEEDYYLRYKKWISYYTSLPFSEGKDFFMLDDCSNLNVADDLYNYIEGDISEDTPIEKMNFYHFDERWGNSRTANHPGWFRSFFFSLDIAKTLGYEKIIHIESDLYLLSQGICDYIDGLESGWVSFRSKMYRFPESSLQIINKDNYYKFENLKQETLARGLEQMASLNVEWLLPVTHVEEGFNGDRFGERNRKQDKDMDYYAQSRLHNNFIFDYVEQFPEGYPIPSKGEGDD